MEINGVILNEYERLDDLHRNGYFIIQNPKNFCFGADAVLLTGFAHTFEGEQLLDLGTGTGIIPILLEAKTNGEKFFGIDIQPDCVEMAQRSIALNKLQSKIEITCCDIKKVHEIYKPSSFDVVTSNPPYINIGGGLLNPASPKAISRHEVSVTLEDVISAASRMLKFAGRFYMVHRPHRLVDIICMLRKYKLEPKKIRFVQPYANKEPNMVLVEAVRSAKPMLKVAPPIIIYNENGDYTNEVIEIYYG